MEASWGVHHSVDGSGARPYRSHSHPACLPCRKRKSRCQTQNAAGKCTMCQLHGTNCIFPQHRGTPSRRTSRSTRVSLRTATEGTLSAAPRFPLDADFPEQTSSANGGQEEILPSLAGIFTETGDDSSHVVSPAIADDSDVLESYLATATQSSGRRLVQSCSAANTNTRLARPVLFNIVPKRPLGVTSHSSRASEKCELIEKFIEPHVNELVDLFFAKTNVCFPLFDEFSFKHTYSNHRRNISPALLSNLYASALVYWGDSEQTDTSRCPDISFIWVQAYEALSSEVFLSPGTSTVISIILNVCGRPSTSIFCNGGMMGMAVAFSNALGLNRNPSSWNISPLEKSIRVKLWWIVVLQDRWCSLAYGTPPLIHRYQHDVPIPTVEDLRVPGASPARVAASSVFLSLITLTEVLGRYLQYVYQVMKDSQADYGTSTVELELLLGEWEERLSDDLRRIVIRGTSMDVPGAANLRLAYLAVKLLLRRIQLDLDKDAMQGAEYSNSPDYLRAQRAAEDIVHFVEELREPHLRGFWMPTNAFTLTSATSFLLRSALRSRPLNENAPFRLARNMVNSLRLYRQNFNWDIADHCLANCTSILEKIESEREYSSNALPNLEEYPDIDLAVLDDLFNGFSDTVGVNF